MGRLLCIMMMLSSFSVSAEDVLTYGGKRISEKDLPFSSRQRIAELEADHYRKKKMLLQEAAIDLYVAERAKKLKLSEEKVRENLFQTKEPTEAEAKKFYEENKGRIPYPYETVKNEIKKMLVGQNRDSARTALLVRIEREKKVRVLLKEPLFPKVELKVAQFYHKGSKKAKVQIVEFADYQCPHCKHAAGSFKKVLAEMGNKVHYTYVDFPINPSGISRVVAEGAFCANKQKKFWEYHYLAFEKQRELTKESPKKLAQQLKLNLGDFDKCLKSKEAKNIVEAGRKEGERVGVSGTPGIYINGRKAQISHDEKSLKEAIQKAMKGAA